jgi:hypothetical protein
MTPQMLATIKHLGSMKNKWVSERVVLSLLGLKKGQNWTLAILILSRAETNTATLWCLTRESRLINRLLFLTTVISLKNNWSLTLTVSSTLSTLWVWLVTKNVRKLLHSEVRSSTLKVTKQRCWWHPPELMPRGNKRPYYTILVLLIFR